MKLTRVHRDGVTIECALRHELTNSAGVAHGGVAATLADAAVGMALNRHFGGKRPITTVEMKINYFLPAAGGRIFARARLLRIGSTLCVGSVDLTRQPGQPAGHGAGDLHVARCSQSQGPPLKEKDSMPPRFIDNLESLKEFEGREIAVTDWLEVTQERIRQFAEATEDRQWIHLDPDRAQRESPYATTIAHGFLTLSLLSHLSAQAIEIREGVALVVNYGLNRVRFPAPVPAGSNIRARFTLQSLKDAGKAREAVFAVTVEIQGQAGESKPKPCCVAEWVIRYYR